MQRRAAPAQTQGLRGYVHAALSCRVVTSCGTGAQVDEEEVAAGLGPGWPSARVLANLQQHCIALSYEACQHSTQGTAGLLQQEHCAALVTRRAAADVHRAWSVLMRWQFHRIHLQTV